MNLSLFVTTITLFFTVPSKNDKYHGEYNLCSESSSRVWGTQIALYEENNFEYNSGISFQGWYSEVKRIRGKYEINGNIIEFHPEEAAFWESYDSGEKYINIYLKENNFINRIKSKKRYDKQTKKNWKLKYFNFESKQKDFYDEKWNYFKPVFKINLDSASIQLIAMDSISVATDFISARKYCKSERKINAPLIPK